MKRALILPFLFSVAFAGADADRILVDYYKAVGREIAKEPRKLGMDGVLQKYQELGERYLLAHKDELHKKAVADYLALPILDFAQLDKLERIAWTEAKRFDDGRTVQPELAKDDFDQIVLMFSESGYGIPPFDRTVLATTWWDPIHAARTVRELALRKHLEREDAERRKFVEQYSPPLLFRLGMDGDQPGIVFFDGQEIFAVELKYAAEGIYTLTAIRWVRTR